MNLVTRALRAARVCIFGREDAGPGSVDSFRRNTAAAQEARDEAESRRMNDWDRTTPVPEAWNYKVAFGAMQGNVRVFTRFESALACFRAHYGERPERACIVGRGYDDSSDGLTAAEREQVEAIEEGVS